MSEILQDPELAATYAERLAQPMTSIKQDRLRSAQRAGDLPADPDLDVAVDLLWGLS